MGFAHFAYLDEKEANIVIDEKDLTKILGEI